jgi:hypothetical protein
VHLADVEVVAGRVVPPLVGHALQHGDELEQVDNALVVGVLVQPLPQVLVVPAVELGVRGLDEGLDDLGQAGSGIFDEMAADVDLEASSGTAMAGRPAPGCGRPPGPACPRWPAALRRKGQPPRPRSLRRRSRSCDVLSALLGAQSYQTVVLFIIEE